MLLALIVLPCSIVGARLYYCFFYEYNYSFAELFNLRSGGLAIYGGVIGGIVGIIIFALSSSLAHSLRNPQMITLG